MTIKATRRYRRRAYREIGGAGAMYRSEQALRLVGSSVQDVACQVAEEVPVGIHFNGIPHAVVMATPSDLDDLAIGFALTDSICLPDEIDHISQRSEGGGFAVDLRLSPPAFTRFLQTRQQRTARSHTSCGICGIESVDQLPKIHLTAQTEIQATAIRLALSSLSEHQTLNRMTGAVHAAAWVTPKGAVVLVREDVGRHNALDKMIGARTRLHAERQNGFCLVTSRCSYEMVQKATAAGFGLIVCISAPTSLAIDEARRAGLALVALARADSQIVYVGQDRVVPAPHEQRLT